MAGETHRFPEQAKQMGQGVKDVGSSVQDRAQEALREGVSSLTETAQEAWETTKEKAGDLASTASGIAQDTWEQSREFIKKYPVACVGAGIGIGFLLGLALLGPVDMTRRMSRYSA